MRKRILMWLFGTDDIEKYMALLRKDREHIGEQMKLIDDHLTTLKKEKENVDLIRKLVKVCRNHGINIDEEIKKIEL